MNADLKIATEQIQRQGKQTATVFHLRGWLDGQSEAQFQTAAEEAYAAGARFLVLDLAEVDTLTSAGMRAIQRVYVQFTGSQNNARMKLCSAPPQVYHVLGLTGFLQSMPMYENLQAALDSFQDE